MNKTAAVTFALPTQQVNSVQHPSRNMAARKHISIQSQQSPNIKGPFIQQLPQITSPSPIGFKEFSIMSEEDKEAFIKEIDDAKNKVSYPENPCLFTTSIKIHSCNKNQEELKSKYKQNKSKVKVNKQVLASIRRLSPQTRSIENQEYLQVKED